MARSLRERVDRMHRKEAREDILAWGYRFFPHYFEAKSSPMHQWMSAKFGSMFVQRGQKAVIQGPRGSAKSTMGTFLLPLYSICEEKEKYIIFTADTAGQAHKYTQGIRAELEGNIDLCRKYPQACGAGTTWNAGHIITRNDVCVEGLGSGSKIRGRRFREFRPGLIVCDDAEGDAASYSSAVRSHV